MPVRDDEELRQLLRRQLVEPLAVAQLGARGRELLRRQPRLVRKPARLAPQKILRPERRCIHRPRHECAAVERESHILRRGRDQHRLDERAERELEIAPGRVACVEMARRVEPELDPVGTVVEEPGLRVVRGRRAPEKRLEPLQLPQVGHATARPKNVTPCSGPPPMSSACAEDATFSNSMYVPRSVW